MEPVIMALKAKYKEKVEFIIVDVDDPQGKALAAQYQVSSIPTFRFLDGEGQLVDSYTGVAGEPVIEPYIEKLIR